MNYGILWSYWTKRQCLPIYETFLKMVITQGLLEDLTDIDESTLYNVEFTRPPLTWIDPAKEMAGIEKELATGIAAKAQVIRRRGGDPEEVMKKRVEEMKEEKENGLMPEEQSEAPNGEEENTGEE